MGISVWQLLIILAIVLVLFGAKRLGSLGGDLGNAVKGFRKAMSDEEKTAADDENKIEKNEHRVFDADEVHKDKDKDRS